MWRNEDLKELGIELNPDMENKFSIYYQYLIEVNSYMNLTAITEEDEVYTKHFLDSLYIKKAINTKGTYTLCDVGSGAGFPSIPLAIIDSNVNVTIIDSLNKRISFLNSLLEKLSLTNVSCYHSRAEEFALSKREYFDYVTARAVARLNILVELCLPLVKIGGKFIAMKGDGGDDELEEAKNAIGVLGGKIEEVINFDLPNGMGSRKIIVIEKIKPTPTKYPRAFAKIKERPI